MNQLVREPYEPAGQTPEELCLELAKATEGEAEREDCMGLLPEDVSIESVRFTEEGILNLDMSGSYEDMSTLPGNSGPRRAGADVSPGGAGVKNQDSGGGASPAEFAE